MVNNSILLDINFRSMIRSLTRKPFFSRRSPLYIRYRLPTVRVS